MKSSTKTARGKRKRSTKAQVIVRRQRLEELMLTVRRRQEILETMRDEFQVGENLVEKDMEAIYASWKERDAENVDKKRADQERRILVWMRMAWRIQDKARCEALYAKIAGTEAPKKIAGHDGGPQKIVLEVVDYRVPEKPVPPKK